MKPRRTMMMLMLGLLLIAAAPASARKWTDDTGKHSVEAELVEVKGGSVHLKKKDGKIITLPVSKLSKADREFLASIAKAKKTPDAAKQTAKEALVAIKALGGRVKVDKDMAIVEVDWRSKKVTDADLEHLKGMTELYHLSLAGTNVTDAGLMNLKGLTQLQSIVLHGPNIKDTGLAHLPLKSIGDGCDGRYDFSHLTELLAAWTGLGPAAAPEAALGEAVPEPSTLLLALLATLGLSFYRRRRRRAF